MNRPLKSYRVYFKPYGSKAKQGQTLTVIGLTVEGARKAGKYELKKRGKFTIIKIRVARY